MSKPEPTASDASPPPKSRSGGKAKIIILVAVVAALLVAARVFDLKSLVSDFMGWVENLGALGPIVVGAFYIVTCVLFLPGSPLTLGAGALFGVVQGTIAVSIGSTLGAAAAFLVGRFFARDWVANKVEGNQMFRTIDGAVGSQGFKIVFLTRLSPVFPFNLLNYAFGLTSVKFRDYFFASWIGMFPATVLFVYLGAAAGELAKTASGGGERSLGQQAFFVVGLIATLAVATVVTKIARKALKDATDDEPSPDSPQPD